MSVRGLLLEMLTTVARALGEDLRARLVFVGGCSTALLVTDEATREEVRATEDIDLIVHLAGRAEWSRLQETLRERGFRESPQDDVICRMRLGNLKVDFMPDDEAALGFTNPWYAKGIETATTYVLTEGLSIRALAPAYFLATKLQAFDGRGGGDLLASRDLEDVLLIVDGRPDIVAEVRAADESVQVFIASALRSLIEHPEYDYLLAGNIRSAGRRGIVHARLLDLGQAGA